MSLKVDRLQLEIVINSDPARKQLSALNEEALKIQKGMRGMKDGSAEYLAEAAKLKAVKTNMDSIYESIGLTGLSLNELRKKQQEFNMVVKSLPANSPEYAQYKVTLDEINSRITELTAKGKQAQGIMAMILGVGGGIGIYEIASAALQKIGSLIKEVFVGGIKSAMEMKDSEHLLLLELNGQKDVQEDLIKLAKQKAGTTMYTRLEIEAAEKFLVIQQRTPEQIKKVIDAATNLASVTKSSLMTAVEELDGTMEGKLSKSLGKLSKDFRDLSKDQLYSGAAIDLVAKKFEGVAENEMDTFSGKLNLLGKGWNALVRTMGEMSISSDGIFSSLIQQATELLGVFQKWFEIPISKKMEDEQSRVNYLASAITDANLTADARNKLYKELEILAPSVVAGLDKENISYQKLTSNLEAYNNQMVNSIIIQKEDEKVKKSDEDLATATKTRIDQEVYMRKQMIDNIQRLKDEAKKQDATNSAASLALAKNYESILYDSHLNFRQKMEKLDKEGAGSMTNSMNMYQMNLATELKAQAEVNMKLQAKNQLIKDLGINTTLVTAKIVDDTKKGESAIVEFSKMSVEQLNQIISAGAVMGASEKEKTMARSATEELKGRNKSLSDLQKYEDDYEKILQSARNIEKLNFAEKLTQTQQEIKIVNEKYDTEIQKLQQYMKEKEKTLTPAQKKGITDETGNLEVTRQAQTNQVLIEAEKDFSDKILQIHENLRVAQMAVIARQVYEVNKKYDDLQKEILDAIEYRYKQEVILANGDLAKISLAEKNKAEAIDKIQVDLVQLEKARKIELDKANLLADQKFEEELKNLKLKGEKALATGVQKIRDEVDSKYKKLLDANVGDEAKTNEIKLQMEKEFNAEVLKLSQETNKQRLTDGIAYAKEVGKAVSGMFSFQDSMENKGLKKDDDVNKKKKVALKARLDAGTMSQKDYDATIAKMDDDAANKKSEIAHKQAVRQKEMAIFNATIALIQSIIQAANIAPPADIVFPIIVAAMQGIALAELIATPVPQAAEGKYDVIGQNDGKLYQNVPQIGTPKTGLYNKPFLGAENGREIVIDNPTTENLMMNYPEVIKAINYARTGTVPQHSSGSFQDIPQSHNPASKMVYVFDPEHTAALKENNRLMKEGIPAFISYDHLRLTTNKINAIEASVSK